MTLLSAHQLTGGYPKYPVIQQVSFSLQPGEWVSLLGANGSGKSTLLKFMSRLLKPSQGVVLLDGQAIYEQDPKQVACRLALLPQEQALPTGLSVWQMVSLGRSPHQAWWHWELSTLDHQKIQEALQLTNLGAFRDRPIEQLSGGERQRAFLALALAQNPKVLLLDEPTTYLDLRYQLELLELLKKLNRERGLSIITVLHDVNLATRYSDRLALLHQGEIWEIGTPQEVITPTNLAKVLGVEAKILETPVGLQICPIAALP